MSAETRELRLTWAGATDQGLVRSQNQDAMYANTDLFVVADGLGGPSGGDVASNLAVRAMVSRSPTTTDDLVKAVHHANEVVHGVSIEKAALHGMGTTLCAMAVVKTDRGHQIGLVNVGDSRAYRHKDGQLEQLTLDHNRVAEMLRHGIITPEEAAVHEHRHTLTRAIGMGPDVLVDSWILNLTGGDRYLLCSDGITNEVSEEEITAILALHSPVSDAASALVRAANSNGGSDNSTALVVDIAFSSVTNESPNNPKQPNDLRQQSDPQQPSNPEQQSDRQSPASKGRILATGLRAELDAQVNTGLGGKNSTKAQNSTKSKPETNTNANAARAKPRRWFRRQR